MTPSDTIGMPSLRRHLRPSRQIAAAVAAVLALGAGAAAAQPVPPHMKPGPHPGTVSAAGEGRSFVAPDLATVSVGVTTQAPTAAQAMTDNNAKQARVIEAVKAQGIEARDLQTQGLNLSPLQDYSRENQPPVISGYQAQNIVSARVHDLAKLGPLLDALIAAGATDVQGVSFSREDDTAARDEARAAAVSDARHRAEVMAQAGGMQLGPLLSLGEGDNQGGPVPMMRAYEAKAAGASTPVEAGEMVLTTQVNGVWALVPAEGGDGEGAPLHPNYQMHMERLEGMRRQPGQEGAPAPAPAPTPTPTPTPEAGAPTTPPAAN